MNTKHSQTRAAAEDLATEADGAIWLAQTSGDIHHLRLTTTKIEQSLEIGFHWLEEHDHDNVNDRHFGRWRELLHAYEKCQDALTRLGSDQSSHESKHVLARCLEGGSNE